MDFAIDRNLPFSGRHDVYSEVEDDREADEEVRSGRNDLVEELVMGATSVSDSHRKAKIHQTAYHGDIRALFYRQETLPYAKHADLLLFGLKKGHFKYALSKNTMSALDNMVVRSFALNDDSDTTIAQSISDQLRDERHQSTTVNENPEKNIDVDWKTRISQNKLLKASVITIALALPISAIVTSFSVAGLFWSLSTGSGIMTSFFALMSVVFFVVGRYSYKEMQANRITYDVLMK